MGSARRHTLRRPHTGVSCMRRYLRPDTWGQWHTRSGTDSRFVFSTSRAFCSSWPCSPVGFDWHAGAASSPSNHSAAMGGRFEPCRPYHTQFVKQIPSVVGCTVFVHFASLSWWYIYIYIHMHVHIYAYMYIVIYNHIDPCSTLFTTWPMSHLRRYIQHVSSQNRRSLMTTPKKS